MDFSVSRAFDLLSKWFPPWTTDFQVFPEAHFDSEIPPDPEAFSIIGKMYIQWNVVPQPW
ncbi:MAG: hypothetical protein WA705_26090 [Candidatus Ozemobacteraceae bacterium]